MSRCVTLCYTELQCRLLTSPNRPCTQCVCVLQCVAVCCCVLPGVAVCCGVLKTKRALHARRSGTSQFALRV